MGTITKYTEDDSGYEIAVPIWYKQTRWGDGFYDEDVYEWEVDTYHHFYNAHEWWTIMALEDCDVYGEIGEATMDDKVDAAELVFDRMRDEMIERSM